MNLSKYLITGIATATMLSTPVFATVAKQQRATPLYMSITGNIADVTETPQATESSQTTESSRATESSQTTESSLVTAVPPLHILTDEEKEMLKKDYASMKITVNGKTIDGVQAALTADGEGLLPLRAIAEAMGLTVEWFGDTRTVQIGKSASVVIGRDAYSVNRAAPQELGIAPQLIKDRTYVPFAFFDEILKAPIVIKDGDTIDLTYPAPIED
ncbi:MAG: copper amine oxidase N-terminal domain-containing protein [Clostridiales bacterium]|jgi:hypothetical protein|nr:copper amine oxidase N-terminal domain-containing protein [Clostridiales bacterium]